MAKIKTTKSKMDQKRRKLSKAKEKLAKLKYKIQTANNQYQKIKQWITTHEVRK